MSKIEQKKFDVMITMLNIVILLKAGGIAPTPETNVALKLLGRLGDKEKMSDWKFEEIEVEMDFLMADAENIKYNA